jgi:hypothetical protein
MELLQLVEWKNYGVRPKADAVCVVSMAANRQPIVDYFRKRGKPMFYIDKGYVRLPGPMKTLFWRFAVNDLHPLRYFAALPPDTTRWLSRMGTVLRQPHDGSYVVIAGSTNRYHSWYGLPEPKEWALEVLSEVRRHWAGSVWWRPKPSQFKRNIAFDLPNCFTDKTKFGLSRTLGGAKVLITHGSAIACDAIWAGTPAVCLGPSIARALSAHSIAEGIKKPTFPTEEVRLEWCGRLASVQFTLEEMTAGLAWDHLTFVLGVLGDGGEVPRHPR